MALKQESDLRTKVAVRAGFGQKLFALFGWLIEDAIEEHFDTQPRIEVNFWCWRAIERVHKGKAKQ